MSDHSSVHGHNYCSTRPSVRDELRELKKYLRKKEEENIKRKEELRKREKENARNNEEIKQLLARLVVGGEASGSRTRFPPPKSSKGKGIHIPTRIHEEEGHHTQPPSVSFYSSHHNDDYYQRPLRQHRHRESSNKEPNITLPPFHGKDNVETCLDWEMKVEQVFSCHGVSEERKVSLETLSFQGHAMYWWSSLEKERRINHEPPIQYWNEIRSALRRRHIPPYYD
uniref:Retrotransposon gag domain-containing protein n=1 Tax=Cajanus cajan TaxID=3821 RepID=A0A151QY14_CAJCA|nr:hypothetical protein KK1_043844 [Cajanus cajan]